MADWSHAMWPGAPGFRQESEYDKRWRETEVAARREACSDFDGLAAALAQELDLATYIDLVEPPEEEEGGD